MSSVGSTITMSQGSSSLPGGSLAKYYQPVAVAKKRRTLKTSAARDPENSFNVGEDTKRLSSQAKILTLATESRTKLALLDGKSLGARCDYMEMINASVLEASYNAAVSTKNHDNGEHQLSTASPNSHFYYDHSVCANPGDGEYLNEIEPVTQYYEKLLEHEKVMIGLKSVCTEELTVPEVDYTQNHIGLLWTESSRLNMKPYEPALLEEDESDTDDIHARTVKDDGVVMFWTDVLMKNRDQRADNLNDDDETDEDESTENPSLSMPVQEDKNMLLLTELMNDVASYAAKISGKHPLPRSPSQNASVAEVSDQAVVDQRNHQHHHHHPCYSAIKTLYLTSCRNMRSSVKANILRYNDSSSFSKANLKYLGENLNQMKSIMSQARKDDAQAQKEFEKFQIKSKDLRTHSAMQVASALERLTEISHEYSAKYEIAKKAFDERSRLNVGFVSATGRHIISDAKMDEIKRSAEEAQVQAGLKVQELQADEISTVLSLRYPAPSQ
jgi:hypothetical protein